MSIVGHGGAHCGKRSCGVPPFLSLGVFVIALPLAFLTSCAEAMCESCGTAEGDAGGWADAFAPDAGSGVDASKGQPDAAPDASACGGTADGIITRDEVPMAAGLSRQYRFASNVSFDTSGSLVNTTRHWDMQQSLANDLDTTITLAALDAAWYADDFPDASYTRLLRQNSDLLGVFKLTDDGLFLLGVVSPTDGLSRTILKHDPPVLLMPLPLSEGDSWQTSAAVTGYVSGAYNSYEELYEGSVDSHGELSTPAGDFAVLRTRMDLTRTVGIFVTTIRQYSFNTECEGTIARIISNDDESEVEFTNASELRRLVP